MQLCAGRSYLCYYIAVRNLPRRKSGRQFPQRAELREKKQEEPENKNKLTYINSPPVLQSCSPSPLCPGSPRAWPRPTLFCFLTSRIQLCPLNPCWRWVFLQPSAPCFLCFPALSHASVRPGHQQQQHMGAECLRQRNPLVKQRKGPCVWPPATRRPTPPTTAKSTFRP